MILKNFTRKIIKFIGQSIEAFFHPYFTSGTFGLRMKTQVPLNTGGPRIVWIQTVRFYYSSVNFLVPKYSILK